MPKTCTFSDAICRLNEISGLITAVGVASSAIAVALALFVHLRSREMAAEAHMHSLFRDYLRLRIEHQISGTDTRADLNAHSLLASVTAFKLYTLEEIHLWLDFRRRSLFQRCRAKASIHGWEESIKYHLDDLKDATKQQILRGPQYYGDSFLLFCANHYGVPELKKWVESGPRKARKNFLMTP